MPSDMPGDLIALAQDAMGHAYAPYSKFRVGAAVRGKSGRLYGGCTVENASYPVGTCAEAGALAAMVTGGDTALVEILVMAGGDDLVTPCGACRQRLREFASDDVPVHLCFADGSGKTVTVGELLPMSFGPDHVLTK
jgi:cytidine deaminase